MGITLFCGSRHLTLSRLPQRPERTLELVQAESSTAAGVRFGHDPYGAEDSLPLRWQGMSTADLAALLDFAEAVLGWMAEPFTLGERFTTEGGHALTTSDGAGGQEDFCPSGGEFFRLAEPRIDHRETAYGRHAVSMTLVRV